MTNLGDFTALNSVRDALNRLDDDLMKSIADIEERLRSVFSVTITYEIDAENKLTFGKYAGKWCLQLNQVPLTKCNRDKRAVMIQHVPGLIAGAPAQIEQMILQRRDALASARSIIDAFEAPSK